MTPFSTFYDHLLPELKGCTTAMLDLHLRMLARDFCGRTSAWRFTWQQPTTVDVDLYDVSEPEAQSEIVRVVRVSVNGTLLWDDAWREHRRGPSESAPTYRRDEPPFTMNDENTELTLVADAIPTATESDGLDLTAALKPSLAATKLPDLLKLQHLEAIRAGTLSRLMRMGGVPWTNQALAVAYDADYQRHCNYAATAAQLGNTNERLRTRATGI